MHLAVTLKACGLSRLVLLQDNHHDQKNIYFEKEKQLLKALNDNLILHGFPHKTFQKWCHRKRLPVFGEELGDGDLAKWHHTGMFQHCALTMFTSLTSIGPHHSLCWVNFSGPNAEILLGLDWGKAKKKKKERGLLQVWTQWKVAAPILGASVGSPTSCKFYGYLCLCFNDRVGVSDIKHCY